MVWLRQHDGADEIPALVALARTQREADLLLGIHTALQLYCAKHPTNGFLPDLIVRRHLRGRLLEAFIGAGLLHPAGHVCECMKGIAWPAGMTYHVHEYLRYNPTADEYDVDRAKKAELKDRELHAAVRSRDRDLCRYCGELTKWADRVSARGLVFDHVDPAVANGGANLVVACRSCNSRKGKRTPEAAGMNLLPQPEDETSTEPGGDPQPSAPFTDDPDPGWSAYLPLLSTSGDGNVPAQSVPDVAASPTSRPPAAGATRPTNGSTTRPTNGSTTRPTNGSTNRSTSWSTNSSTSGPTTLRGGTGRDGTGRADVGDAGPAGERDLTGPAPPRRNSRFPDPYRRTAVTGPDPADHPGLPTPADLARGPPPEGHPS